VAKDLFGQRLQRKEAVKNKGKYKGKYKGNKKGECCEMGNDL